MKLPILFLGAMVVVGAAFADEDVVQKVTPRKTCAEISAEITTLLAIETPDSATLDNLKQLQTQQRNNCVPKSAGRRITVRNNAINNSQLKAPDMTISDALSEYLINKKANCETLNLEIEKLVSENDTSDVLAAMRGVYDMDCVENKNTVVSSGPEKTEEELAAEYDANLMAGLCGDGTKPNKYGCCTDEVFKDLGNMVFACCPRSGGDCFPPITSAK